MVAPSSLLPCNISGLCPGAVRHLPCETIHVSACIRYSPTNDPCGWRWRETRQQTSCPTRCHWLSSCQREMLQRVLRDVGAFGMQSLGYCQGLLHTFLFSLCFGPFQRLCRVLLLCSLFKVTALSFSACEVAELLPLWPLLWQLFGLLPILPTLAATEIFPLWPPPTPAPPVNHVGQPRPSRLSV